MSVAHVIIKQYNTHFSLVKLKEKQIYLYSLIIIIIRGLFIWVFFSMRSNKVQD